LEQPRKIKRHGDRELKEGKKIKKMENGVRGFRETVIPCGHTGREQSGEGDWVCRRTLR